MALFLEQVEVSLQFCREHADYLVGAVPVVISLKHDILTNPEEYVHQRMNYTHAACNGPCWLVCIFIGPAQLIFPSKLCLQGVTRNGAFERLYADPKAPVTMAHLIPFIVKLDFIPL